MSEYREHYPLLHDELSEEDQSIPRHYRRRSFSNRNRIKVNLKGAAAIIKHWPDHWTRFVAYWWIGLGMITITTFIIYNSFFILTLMPEAQLKPVTNQIFDTGLYKTNKPNTAKTVWMHVFIEKDKEIDFDEYIPYIKLLSEKHPSYIYRLIVVLNDTKLSNYHITGEENNEIAMNTLWTEKVYSNEKNYGNVKIRIEYISLSRCLDDSALTKFWRELPEDFIKFMVRALSVWDRGGIAFNPNVLTPISPSTVYINKLQDVLSKYEKDDLEDKTINSIKHNTNDDSHRYKAHKKLNNIRDIIDALETNEQQNKLSEEPLAETESKTDIILDRNEQNTLLVTEQMLLKDKSFAITTLGDSLSDKSSKTTPNSIIENRRLNNNRELIKEHQIDENVTSTTVSLLPMFLDFLFHRKPNPQLTSVTREHEISSNPKNFEQDNFIESKETVTNGHPIFPKTDLKNRDSEDIKRNDLAKPIDSASYRLTIDLNGNIIASNTTCHAFIGTLFNDALNYKGDQSITEFITTELSLFCNGVLMSCIGIDVILI